MWRLATLPIAWAWWDNGHMLTAEIARQQLSENEIKTINGLLEDWSDEFPGTSDLVTAAVWPDQLKCGSHSAICRREQLENIHLFDPWHFDEKPYNPDGMKLPEGTDQWMPNPSASFTLTSAMVSMGTSNSRFTFNFMLRWVLHIVGDIHQPLHTANGFFNDTNRGYLPNGDRGGNRIPVLSPCGANNLHFYWDSAACEYLLNWSPGFAERGALTANASSLIAEHPKSSFSGRYDTAPLNNCWSELRQTGRKDPRAFDTCQQVFVSWVNDTFDIAVAGVYNISKNTEIPAKYAAWAKELARKQIALGGYRLGDFLRLVAQQGVEAPPRKQSQSGWDITTKIFAALTFLFAALLVVLTICLLKLRRRVVTSPSDVDTYELNAA